MVVYHKTTGGYYAGQCEVIIRSRFECNREEGLKMGDSYRLGRGYWGRQLITMILQLIY